MTRPIKSSDSLKLIKKKFIKQRRTNAKKLRRSTRPIFKSYIHKVLRIVHPDLSISKKGIKIMDSLVCDVFHRFSCQASKMSKISKRRTLTVQDFQSSTRLILPGDLGQHTLLEGRKAVNNFMKSRKC